MEKLLMRSQEELDRFFNDHDAGYYFSRQRAESFPLVLCYNYQDSNSRKDWLYFEYVYLKDFEYE